MQLTLCYGLIHKRDSKHRSVLFSIKVTTLNSNFLMVYRSENISFLYLHFIWLYGSWNHHRILKKHPFWKYDSWFSSEVSKLASVRNKLIMSLKYWFMEAKNVFRSCYGPKKWPKYHLKTILTTFSERNEYYGTILVKINFCHAWKCMISGVLCSWMPIHKFHTYSVQVLRIKLTYINWLKDHFHTYWWLNQVKAVQF